MFCIASLLLLLYFFSFYVFSTILVNKMIIIRQPNHNASSAKPLVSFVALRPLFLCSNNRSDHSCYKSLLPFYF